MSEEKKPDEPIPLTLADLVGLFKLSKKSILIWVASLTAVGFILALFSQTQYSALAIFRERKNTPRSNSLAEFLTFDMPNQNSENEFQALAKTRKIIKPVIENLGLQGSLDPVYQKNWYLSQLKSNLMAIKAKIFNSRHPLQLDRPAPVKLASISYEGEVPLQYEVSFSPNGEFQLTPMNPRFGTAKNGKIGMPIEVDGASFIILLGEGVENVPDEPYYLNIDTVDNCSKNYCYSIKIVQSKLEKGIINLTFTHPNRQLASQFANRLMDAYQEYLVQDRDYIAGLQLEYLNNRQTQLASNLASTMERHANFLENDLYGSGFVDSEKEITFLAHKQHEFREKLIQNELELKRLAAVEPNNCVFYEKTSPSEGDYSIINNVLIEMRDLRQRRDWLEIETQKSNIAMSTLQNSFQEHIKELDTIRIQLADLHDLMDRLQQHLPPDISTSIYNDHRFLIKDWLDRLDMLAVEDPNQWKRARENFFFYLTNLDRLFNVHERILYERLTHQQNPIQEYQGIDFKVASDLYLQESKMLVELESSIRQTQFFIDQIADENFEITSLSSSVNDPVSQEIIKNASQFVLALRDENNRSVREQSRLKDELQLQRTFLTLHLKQMVHLMQLNKQLHDEKVYVLQTVSLSLIHQQLSLLENTLTDYIESRTENLREEREIIKHHLRDIHKEMKNVPRKWMAEQLIEQEVEINKLIVEEIAKMVESKNIIHNLEVVQSAPLDHALPPIHPNLPPIILYSFLGAFLGLLISCSSSIFKGIKYGIPINADHLILQGCHVSGSLDPTKPDSDDNINTMRRLINFFGLSDPSPMYPRDILLLISRGYDYSLLLADLITKKEQRVLRIALDEISETSPEKNGLLQYLKGEIAFPSIVKGAFGDFINFGGSNAFAMEYIGSTRFHTLVRKLKDQYDWILFVSHSSAVSAAGEQLIAMFESMAITITDETLNDFKPQNTIHDFHLKHATFLFSSKVM